MAIDPRIALQVRAPDLGGAISQGLQNASGFQQLQHFRQDRESDKLLGLAMGGDNSALERLKVAAPKKYVAARKTMNDLTESEKEAATKSYAQTVVQASGLLAQGNQQGVIDLLTQRSAELEANGRDNSHTLRGLQLAQAGEWDKLKMALNEEATGLERLGYLKGLKGQGSNDFDYLTENFTPEEIDQARRIKAGLAPRAVGSSSMTIVNQGLTDQVADSQSTIKGAEEGAKLEQQLLLKPQIEAAVTTAKKEAEANAETFTDLKRAKAAMPGLLEVSDKLKKLADIATYTVGGRLWDTAVKELGFGSTDGGTARSTMVAVVDNQVLPLLRETFGAAFTKAEGDSLRATLLDADATPEAKKSSLDAFIEQKYRNIQTKEAELGGGEGITGGVGEGQTATNPQTGQKIIFRGGQWQPM